MMIHGSSHDPVLVKKVSLKMWTLRDEIESVIQESSLTEGADLDASIDEIRQEYKRSNPSSQETIVDDSAQEQAPEEEAPDSELDAFDQAQEEVEQAEQAKGDEDDSGNEESLIIQRRPEISDDKMISAVAILAELSMDGIYLFCNREIMPGQSIVIDFIVPKKFIVNAEVVSCRPYNMKSRIISENKMPFRAAIRFTFLKKGERTLLRQFLESIEPDLQDSKNSAEIAKAASKGSDDLGDLDDLDL